MYGRCMRIFLLTFRLYASSIFTVSASHLFLLKIIGLNCSVLDEKARAALSHKGAFILPLGRAHNPVCKHSYCHHDSFIHLRMDHTERTGVLETTAAGTVLRGWDSQASLTRRCAVCARCLSVAVCVVVCFAICRVHWVRDPEKINAGARNSTIAEFGSATCAWAMGV